MLTTSMVPTKTIRKATIRSILACVMMLLIICLASAPNTAFADQGQLRAAPFDSEVLEQQSNNDGYFKNDNYVIYFEGGQVGIVEYIGSAKNVKIPEAVKLNGNTYPVVQIFDNAFAGTKIESVSVPKTIRSIDAFAFANCKLLSKVTGCKNLMHIGNKAFYQCSKLKSFPFGKKIEFIELGAFSSSKVKKSTYPNSLDNDGTGNYILRSYIVRVKGQERYADAYKVLSLVNKERAKEGLPKLVMDKDLLKAAMQRAAEITVVWDHTRPNGLPCETADPSGKMYGENIAYGQDSPSYVMYRWMNSTGHRANILSEDFKSIGIGCFKWDGQLYWVQDFGYAKADKAKKPNDKTATHKVAYLN